MSAPTDTTESASPRMSMKDRVRAALTGPGGPGDQPFTAGGLKYILVRHERADIEALWNAEEGQRPRARYWAAFRVWEGENAVSTGNMRRICEELVAEGLLSKDLDVRGRYKWAYYRLAGAGAP